MKPDFESAPGPLSFRARFDDWFMARAMSPLVRLCCRWGVRPNAVTAAGLLITAAIPILHQAGLRTLAALAMPARQLLDCLDGEVARRCRRTSATGAILDSVSDAVFYYVLLWLIASRLTSRPWAVLGLAAFAFVVLAAVHVAFSSFAALIDHAKTYDTPSLYRRGYAFLINNSLLFIIPVAAFYRLTAG